MSKKWDKVGNWMKSNAGQGVALVGSLLTGNVAGAVAAGVSMVTSAAGVSDPDAVLAQLQGNPETMVKLRELTFQNEASIREHLRVMAELEFKDEQAQHEQTQLTIRAGDAAEDKFVRWTRPLMAWTGLLSGLIYVVAKVDPSDAILAMLFAAPWAYMGLRTADKRTASRAVKAGA